MRLPLAALPLVALATLAAPRPASAHPGFDERLEVADRRVAEAPGDPAAYLDRAELQRRHGDWPAALADLERAAEQSRASPPPELAYERGLALLDAGRAREAEAALDAYLERAPGSPAGHAARGRARAAQGRQREAADDFAAAIEHQPVPLPEYYLERARALAAAGGAQRDEALRTLDEGMLRLGAVPSLGLAAVDLELERGAVDAALARLERLARVGGAQPVAWRVRRAEILEGAGRTQEARESYARALHELEALPPRRREAPALRDLAARVREALGRLEARRLEARGG